MPHPSKPPHWITRYARRITIAAFGALLLYAVVAFYRLLENDPLPDPRVHTLLLTIPAVGGLVFLFLGCYFDLRRRLGHVAGLILQEGQLRVESMSRMTELLLTEFAERSDIPTDRVFATASVRPTNEGGAQVVRLPSSETREAFRRVIERINGGPSGDTAGDNQRWMNTRE